MRRAWIAVLVGCALLATTCPAAAGATTSAHPNVPAGLPRPSGTISGPEPVPAPPVHYPAGDVCPFAVDVVFSVNEVVAYSYRDAQGTLVAQYFTGTLTGRLTRPDTGRTITTDLSGKGVEVYDAQGNGELYGLGPYLAGFHAGDSPAHLLARPNGYSDLKISAAGRKTLVYASRVQNLCTDLR